MHMLSGRRSFLTSAWFTRWLPFAAPATAAAAKSSRAIYDELGIRPILNFRGTPLGIDLRRVMETGILPQINTGIAHRKPGIGMVGAGILRAPEDCFRAAFEAVRQL